MRNSSASRAAATTSAATQRSRSASAARSRASLPTSAARAASSAALGLALLIGLDTATTMTAPDAASLSRRSQMLQADEVLDGGDEGLRLLERRAMPATGQLDITRAG